MESSILVQYEVSGGIAGWQSAVIVHADGTLRVTEKDRPEETTTVDPQRLQSLVEALDSPEWQQVESVYGHVVFDGFETTLEGAGITTTILDFSCPLPPVVSTVLGELRDLHDLRPPGFGGFEEASTRQPGFPEPDRYELGAAGLAIVYQRSGQGGWLRYVGGQDTAVFNDDEIDLFDSPHGQFVSVQSRLDSAVDRRFSVLLPSFRLAGPGATSQVHTVGLHDTVTGGIVPPGPPHRPGQQQSIEVVSLRGLARVAPADGHPQVPPELLGRRWTRSHEEERTGEEVYRTEGFAFPPSHPRAALEFDQWGVAIVSMPHPLDQGTVPQFGHWTAVESHVVELRQPDAEPTLLRLLEVTDDLLRVQREQPIGRCAGWIAVHDREPGGAPTLWVRGTCRFPDAGTTVALRRHEPQGVNPADLLLLMVVERAEPAATVVTDREVEYREDTDHRYETVTILPDGPTIRVQEAW